MQSYRLSSSSFVVKGWDRFPLVLIWKCRNWICEIIISKGINHSFVSGEMKTITRIKEFWGKLWNDTFKEASSFKCINCRGCLYKTSRVDELVKQTDQLPYRVLWYNIHPLYCTRVQPSLSLHLSTGSHFILYQSRQLFQVCEGFSFSVLILTTVFMCLRKNNFLSCYWSWSTISPPHLPKTIWYNNFNLHISTLFSTWSIIYLFS